MSGWRIGLLLALGAVSAASGAAPTDLSKIDRTIKKEPVYRSKKPLYCRVAFGREAKTRVWLVLDGEVLYADRDGDGDLTGPGKQFKASKQGSGLVFEVGKVADGKHTHTELSVNVVPAATLAYSLGEQPGYRELMKADPAARVFRVEACVVVPGQKGNEEGGRVKMVAGPIDAAGLLQFGDRPARAPVIHFGGPWQMALYTRQSLPRGRAQDLVLGFGTPGQGRGTFCWCGYEGLVPEAVDPVVEITFAPKKAGAKPVRARWALAQRC